MQFCGIPVIVDGGLPSNSGVVISVVNREANIYGIGDVPYTKCRPNDRADPVGHFEGDYGFWDESWSCWNGGYKSEEDAREALRIYAFHLG